MFKRRKTVTMPVPKRVFFLSAATAALGIGLMVPSTAGAAVQDDAVKATASAGDSGHAAKPAPAPSEAVVFPDVIAEFPLIRHGVGVAEGGFGRAVR
ncbi:hypothetical protein ACIBCO_40575, partial [Streptomyces violascens]|uniref:hypothetical protein n=1 Tax=Streptomyces violascens TaxID=67381 RepID=UPI00378A2C95